MPTNNDAGMEEFWLALLTGEGSLVGTAPSDGSIDYYLSETEQIQRALDSDNVAPERKRELRAQQAELDRQFHPQRVEDATSRLQNASTDAEALAAVQELERLQMSPSGGGSVYGGTAPYSNGRPTYDPTDEATIRREWESGPRYQGVSYDEYRRQVQQANPNGELRYTGTALQGDGMPSTYPGFNNLGQTLAGIDQTALTNAQIQRQADLGYYDNVTSRALGNIDSSNQAADARSAYLLDGLRQSGTRAQAEASGLTAELRGEADRQNARSDASLARYTGAVDTANAGNLAALDAYSAGIDPYRREIGGTTYTAVRPDAEGLGYQRQALGMGSSIYGGSLDYQSQGAQAYASAADIARTEEGLGMLRDQVYNGGNEQRANLAHAREELARGGDNQREILELALDEYRNGGAEQREILDLALNEFHHGGDRQREVYDRYEDISRPEMTAAERAILAQSQRQYALQDKASRDAVASNLEARGILSGAGQIAGQQAAQQRLGEERVSGTLGAQAQAVQRALIGLQGMENTANSLRAGDQQALGLSSDAATRLRQGQQTALALSKDAANSLRQGEQQALALEQQAANALRAGDLAAAQSYTQAAQAQRAQGFHEAYSRGIAADNAAANNQATRLGGAQIYANQANQIRADNDAISTFNANQQGITDRFNAQHQQNEYIRLADLQQSEFDNRIGVYDTNLLNERNLNDDSQRAYDAQFGRYNTGAQTGLGTIYSNYGIDAGYTGVALGENAATQSRNEAQEVRRIGAANERLGLSQSTNRDVQDALRQMGSSRVDIYGLNSLGSV